jgi:hypothetical protein
MRRHTVFCLLIGLLGLLVLGLPASAQSEEAPRIELAVIVGTGSSVKGLGQGELRRLYLGEAVTEPGGRKLVPYNHPAQTVFRVGFDRVVLGMSPDEMSRYWIDRKIRGLSGPPRTVDSALLLLRVVERLPGAIGYVQAAHVRGDVRAVPVDGKLPGDAGYPVAFKR